MAPTKIAKNSPPSGDGSSLRDPQTKGCETGIPERIPQRSYIDENFARLDFWRDVRRSGAKADETKTVESGFDTQ